MKMNKLSYISLLVAGLMTMSSCSDILDTPSDNNSVGKYLLAVQV